MANIVKIGILIDAVDEGGAKVNKFAQRAAKDWKLMGAAIGGAALAAGAALTALAVRARGFAKAMGEVKTLVDSSVTSNRELQNVVEDMVLQFGGDSITQAKALYSTISAGFGDAASAAEIMTVANKLAIGGVTDIDTAVDGLTSVLNSYGASAGAAAKASNSMFVAVREGKTTIGELSRSLGQVTPIASNLGVSFDSVAAAVSTITKSGVTTSDAVTQLRSVLVAVTKQGAKAKQAAKDLGVDFSTTALRTKGLAKFLDDVFIRSGATKEQIIALTGRVEGFNAVLNLTKGEGAEFVRILGLMRTDTEAATSAFEKMAKSGAFAFERLQSAVSLTLDVIGLRILDSDVFGGLADGAIDMAKIIVNAFRGLKAPLETSRGNFREFSRSALGTLAKGLMLAFDALNALRKALEGTSTTINAAVFGFASIRETLASWVPMTGKAIRKLAELRKVTDGARAAMLASASAGGRSNDAFRQLGNQIDAFVDKITQDQLPAMREVDRQFLENLRDRLLGDQEAGKSADELARKTANLTAQQRLFLAGLRNTELEALRAQRERSAQLEGAHRAALENDAIRAEQERLHMEQQRAQLERNMAVFERFSGVISSGFSSAIFSGKKFSDVLADIGKRAASLAIEMALSGIFSFLGKAALGALGFLVGGPAGAAVGVAAGAAAGVATSSAGLTAGPITQPTPVNPPIATGAAGLAPGGDTFVIAPTTSFPLDRGRMDQIVRDDLLPSTRRLAEIRRRSR